MSGHRRYWRRRSSSSGRRSTSRSSMRASTAERDNDVHGGHRRLKRSPASHHSWVLLNRRSAQRDAVPGDHTTSAMSRTSKGEEISVSFELVEPPGISVLTVDWPLESTPTTPRTSITGNVIAAHRDVVLLAITTTYETNSTYQYQHSSVIDLFVYQASRYREPSQSRRPSSLLMLLPPSAVGHEIYSHLLGNGEIGIMSCTSNDVDDDDDSLSFVVAELRIWRGNGITIRLFWSGTGQWETFENMHVHGANGGHDLHWWSTDAVVPYGRRFMIWVDYYRGMVIMDLLSQSEMTTTNQPLPPRLRYVALPVNRVENPVDIEFGGRGCPKASRSVCVTRHGVKFVSVDSQHRSNFGLGNHHVLEWSHRFRITTWSLCEDDDNYTWRRDLTIHEEEFCDAFNGGHRFPFPHVQPGYPIVDVNNPDIVAFRIENPVWCDHDETNWMIEVDLRKKVLLEATAYSKENDGDDPIPSELPRYLDDEQTCKKRR